MDVEKYAWLSGKLDIFGISTNILFKCILQNHMFIILLRDKRIQFLRQSKGWADTK